MVDTVTPAKRSSIMSRIRARDSKPEMRVRRTAHALGYRFRLHRRDLPGTPDLVFSGRRKVVFVHGCWWHRHDGCRKASAAKSNVEFWRAKFERNTARDAIAERELRRLGWEVLVVWECQTADAAGLRNLLADFLGRPVLRNSPC